MPKILDAGIKDRSQTESSILTEVAVDGVATIYSTNGYNLDAFT